MKIAFVGKGGAGKTTLTALFVDFLAKNSTKPIVIFDADVNMHVGDLLGFDDLETLTHLSSKQAQAEVRAYIQAHNPRIVDPSHVKKTTPPTEDSGFFVLQDPDNLLFKKFARRKDHVYLSVVGAYETDGIGTSCYHNSLSILESILSHTIDTQAHVVADMVAGVDAFAGSLHAQFDLLVLSIEPTERSLAVYTQYAELAQHANVFDRLYVVGNKIEDIGDESFILKAVPKDKYLGSVLKSGHIRRVDKGVEPLDSGLIEDQSKATLKSIYNVLLEKRRSYNERLSHLVALHKRYVAQEYIVARAGDLTSQIQEGFDFDGFVRDHYGE